MEDRLTFPRNTMLTGDCLSLLKTLPDHCIHACITSPPYWWVRAYVPEGDPAKPLEIGMEETFHSYLERLVTIFREVRRVLREDGSLWLNMGDSYAYDTKGKGGHTSGEQVPTQLDLLRRRRRESGLPDKNLLGQPWRLALALQQDGWWLRSDCIWFKTNPLPEPARDRPVRAHEYLFLLTKRPQYYYDTEAIREPLKPSSLTSFGKTKRAKENDAFGMVRSRSWNQHTPVRLARLGADGKPVGAQKHSVWQVGSSPYPEAHYATFPPKLIEPCVLASSSPSVCESCGAPWKRTKEQARWGIPTGDTLTSPSADVAGTDAPMTCLFPSVMGSERISAQGPDLTHWEPTCACEANQGRGKSLILDPFMGAGTTALVAAQLGRDYLGMELQPSSVEVAQRRLAAFPPHIEEGEVNR